MRVKFNGGFKQKEASNVIKGCLQIGREKSQFFNSSKVCILEIKFKL